MRGILFLTICEVFFLHEGKAQFFIISDPGGYVNVRANPGTDSPILLRLKNNEVVYQDEYEEERKDNWVYIMFYVAHSRNKKQHDDDVPGVMKNMWLRYGYVYKDRVKQLVHLAAFKKKKINENSISFDLDSIKISIRIGSFEKSKHKLTKMPETDNIFTKVDGKDFIGTDGDMPRTEIKSFFITVGNKAISVPRSAFNDLFEPNIDNTSVHLGNDGNFYVVMYNSDGAGSYLVLFIFNRGRYQKRIIFNNSA